jgi:hypothetical protein
MKSYELEQGSIKFLNRKINGEIDLVEYIDGNNVGIVGLWSLLMIS